MKARKPAKGLEGGGHGEADPLNRDAGLRELAEAAQRFVNKTPRYRRTVEDRQCLLDALTRAQLVLSLEGHRPARQGLRRPWPAGR